MAKRSTHIEQYEVLIDFIDMQDKMTVYRSGKDKYPRTGYAPTAERIEYLRSSANILGRPIIAKR